MAAAANGPRSSCSASCHCCPKLSAASSGQEKTTRGPPKVVLGTRRRRRRRGGGRRELIPLSGQRNGFPVLSDKRFRRLDASRGGGRGRGLGSCSVLAARVLKENPVDQKQNLTHVEMGIPWSSTGIPHGVDRDAVLVRVSRKHTRMSERVRDLPCKALPAGQPTCILFRPHRGFISPRD